MKLWKHKKPVDEPGSVLDFLESDEHTGGPATSDAASAVPRRRRGHLLLRLRDLISDVSVELASRLSRTVLMVSAVAFSTGALLASVGISQNAAHQIDADIAASATRQILVTIPGQSDDSQEASEDADATEVHQLLPDDTEERLAGIDTVVASGRRLDLDGLITLEVERPVIGAEGVNVGVRGVVSGYLDAAEITPTTDMAWMLDGEQNVAFLGEAAAEKLGIPVTSDTRGLSVNVNNVGYSIIGFLRGENSFSDSIVIPYKNAVTMARGDDQSQVLILTKLGAGSQVSGVARLAILPAQPEKLAVSQVIAPNAIRENVSDQLTTQATWVGAFLIVLTILLITNSMIVSVTARTTEIGVRRALGASRASVGGVFLCEGGIIGALGGLAGAALASVVITVVAAVNSWSAYLNLGWIALGPVLGMVVGLAASAYPAMRAATIQPAIAVRSD